MQILKNSRKSILFHDQRNWQKKSGLFDVTMGSYDGCELCELVGLYIIDTVKTNHPYLNFGLYRDDGLGALTKRSKPELKRIEKKLRETFKTLGLKITCDTDMNVVNFLDVTLDMEQNTIAPYRKENDTPLYIHKDSNHPPHIAKQVPIAINKRLNNISSNKEIFDNAKHDYEKALRDSNLKSKLKYSEQKKKRRKRTKKDQIWFTPPYCALLKTRLGEEFLSLIDKHFPIASPLSNIFNRHTIKLSYSCSENMATIIQNHNRKVLSEKPKREKRLCNCREPKNCPVNNKCLEENIIYKATVKNKDKEATYIGCTTTTFKERFANHKKASIIIDINTKLHCQPIFGTITYKKNQKSFGILSENANHTS